MKALLKYDAVCAALAECKSLDEVREIHNRAEAMRHYGRQAKNRTLEVDAAEIRIRAERRLGEMLTEGQSTEVLARRGRQPKRAPRATLREIGVDNKLSMRAQRLAAAPDFERRISNWRHRALDIGGRVTPALPESPIENISKHRARISRPFLIDARDMRALSMATVRRLAVLLPKIADHCGSASDHDRVGDCISDSMILKLAAGA